MCLIYPITSLKGPTILNFKCRTVNLIPFVLRIYLVIIRLKMANDNLRTTDFLPSRFKGETINSDLARAHFLAFQDYLDAHNIAQPEDNAALLRITNTFKRTLEGQARLWIEGKQFQSFQELRTRFLARFSPSNSHFAKSQEFQALTYTAGDTAEVHLAKITKVAHMLQYNDDQVRDKFLSSLPTQCRSAVLMAAPMDAPLPLLVDKAQCYFDLQSSQNSTASAIAADVMTTQDMRKPTAQGKTFQSDMQDIVHRMEALESKFTKSEQPKEQARSSRSRNREQRGNFDQNRRRSYNRSSNQRRRFNSIMCDFCSRQGHTWRNCFERLNQRAQSYAQYEQNDFRQAPNSRAYQNFY